MEIKGSAVITIREYVKNVHHEKYEHWLLTLPPDSRTVYEKPIDSSSWYPCLEAAVIPTTNIGELFFNGDKQKGAWNAGRYSAEKALTGIYKIFLKAANPGFIIQRASRIFATYYRPCVMTTTERGPQNVTISLSSDEEILPVIEYRIAGWCDKGLELSGVKNVTLDIARKMEDGKYIVDFIMKWE